MQLDPETGELLFETLPWRVELDLRPDLQAPGAIEARENTIRVVPRFNPFLFSDVLLVTSPALTRDEFLAWSYLLQVVTTLTHISVLFHLYAASVIGLVSWFLGRREVPRYGRWCKFEAFLGASLPYLCGSKATRKPAGPCWP